MLSSFVVDLESTFPCAGKPCSPALYSARWRSQFAHCLWHKGEAIDRLLQQPVTASELDRAKRYLTGTHAIDRQRSAARAASLALDGRYGLGTDAALQYPEQIAALTREDLLRVAQRVIRLESRVEACVRP